jgi:DNA-binding transcriptional MerR regulator
MRSQFSTSEAAELTGATVRKIDHWASTGLLKPSGRDADGKGTRRRFTFRDVVALRAIEQLREKNCPLQQIRATVAYLARHYPGATNAEVLARLTLLTDGKRVYLLSDERQVMDVLTKQFVWSIPIGRLILDTRARVEDMPTHWVEKVRIRGAVYHLDIVRDEESGWYSAQCRELQGAIEQGRTLTEAKANGSDAIESVLAYIDKRAGGSARVKAQ